MSRPPKLDQKWTDISPGELTDLQMALRASDMSRDFNRVVGLFKETGVDLIQAFDAAVVGALDESIVVLDEGCGTGASIEQFWHIMKDREKLRGRALHTIGVDVNPLPSRMPKHVMEQKIHTEFLKDDAAFLRLPDNSVNFGYSVAMLRYCKDPLRVLEEAYRVLKPNGIMIWYLSSLTDVSCLPFTENIFRNTPGGEENFWFSMGGDGNRGALICQKNPDVRFEGFPYELHFTFPSLFKRTSVNEFLGNKVYRRNDEEPKAICKSTKIRTALLALGAALALLPCDQQSENHHQASAVASTPAPSPKTQPKFEQDEDNFEFSMLGLRMKECDVTEKTKISGAFAALRIGIRFFIGMGKEAFIDFLAVEGDIQSKIDAADLYEKLPKLIDDAKPSKTNVTCGFLDENTAGIIINEGPKVTNIALKTEPVKFVNDIPALAGSMGHELLHKHDYYGLHGHSEEDGLDLPYRFGLLIEMYLRKYQEENR